MFKMKKEDDEVADEVELLPLDARWVGEYEK